MDKKLQEQVSYWKDTSLRDFETAKSLFKLKRYDACLFFCHLALEKILKGLVVIKTEEPAPYIHDLAHLAAVSKLPATEEQMKNLRSISTFNIAGRYDNVKQEFYKKCTKEYTEKHLEMSKTIYVWLEKQFPKK
jgi:HEPN domain-containing protein